MLKIAKNDEESIRNSDTFENVDVIKMPRIAKNSQEGTRFLIPLKPLV